MAQKVWWYLYQFRLHWAAKLSNLPSLNVLRRLGLLFWKDELLTTINLNRNECDYSVIYIFAVLNWVSRRRCQKPLHQVKVRLRTSNSQSQPAFLIWILGVTWNLRRKHVTEALQQALQQTITSCRGSWQLSVSYWPPFAFHPLIGSGHGGA